jgi:subtilisin family serine protease
MPQFHVIVDKLNKRKTPVIDFTDKSNIAGVVLRNYSFESDGEITNILGRWIKDRDGYYYWREGLAGSFLLSRSSFSIPDQATIDFDESKMSWAFSPSEGVDVISLWNTEKLFGQNVRVAVLDSGINSTIPDLVNSIEDRENDLKSFVNNESVEDDFGHGTSCASIISSQGINLYGVSPKIKLIIGKIYSNNAGQTPEILLAALQWACEDRKADIISMSFSFPYVKTDTNDVPIKYKQVADYIKMMSSTQNKLFLSSIGNLGEDAKDFGIFPANAEGCISVGAHGHDKLAWSGSSWNSKISFLAPGVDLKGYNLSGQKIVLQAATSFACPFAVAVIANLLSYYKTKDIPYSSTEFIGKLVFDSPPVDNPFQYGRGVLNPIETFKKIRL